MKILMNPNKAWGNLNRLGHDILLNLSIIK